MNKMSTPRPGTPSGAAYALAEKQAAARRRDDARRSVTGYPFDGYDGSDESFGLMVNGPLPAGRPGDKSVEEVADCMAAEIDAYNRPGGQSAGFTIENIEGLIGELRKIVAQVDA
jgi:hypothetical protein